MFRLPAANHPARNLIGDIASLVETLNPANAGRLPAVWQAVRQSRAAFEGEGVKPSRVCYVIVRYDTAERWLISIGPKGGWRKEWNFGSGV